MGAPTFVTELDGALGGGDSRTFTLPAYTEGDDVLLLFMHHADLFFANSFILDWQGTLAPTANALMSNGVQDSVEMHVIKPQVGDSETVVRVFNTRSAAGAQVAALVYGPDNDTMAWDVQSSTEGVVTPTSGAPSSGTQNFPAVEHDLGPGDKLVLYVCIGTPNCSFTPQEDGGPVDGRVTSWTPRAEVHVFEQIISDEVEYPADAVDWTNGNMATTFERIVCFRLLPVADHDGVFV